MEKLSKILLVALIICLVIIVGYAGYLGSINYKINMLDNQCEQNICKVGIGNVTSYHYSPLTGICHCFNGNEVEKYYELPYE